MAKRIELPQSPRGDAEEQLRAMYSYLYQMAEAMNSNLAEIGGAELTDGEREQMQAVIGKGTAPDGELNEAETLKSLIVKTANFVQSRVNEFRTTLLGQYVAEGKFGKYVRQTGLDVDITPEGIQQNFSFEEVIRGLRTYEINAKNYIKTGLLRTVNNIPVYGVAIGKDIVTFSQDGTETYNDGNKVAELTADELSFWGNGNKLASYKGNRIGFYYGGSEVMYIQQGKIYTNTELNITSAGAFELDADDLKISSSRGAVGALTKVRDNYGNWFTVLCSFGQRMVGSLVASNEVDGESFIVCNTNGSKVYTEVGVHDSICVEGSTMDLAMYLEYRENPDGVSRMTMRLMSREHVPDPVNPNSGTQYPRPTAIETNYAFVKSDLEAYGIYYNWMVQRSSRDIKHDIRDMEPVGEKLDALRPVTFVYDDDPKERTRAGLIYEEAAEVMPEICTEGENRKAINYVELVPMLLKEIQDLRARVKALEEREGG